MPESQLTLEATLPVDFARTLHGDLSAGAEIMVAVDKLAKGAAAPNRAEVARLSGALESIAASNATSVEHATRYTKALDDARAAADELRRAALALHEDLAACKFQIDEWRQGQ